MAPGGGVQGSCPSAGCGPRVYGSAYSMTRRGAPAASPSKDLATRLPEPVTTRTRALPADQPGRSTTGWIRLTRLGVRWSGPMTPTVGHGFGVQLTVPAPRGREDTLRATIVKGKASSLASACRPRVVGSIE